jgi:alanine racemase
MNYLQKRTWAEISLANIAHNCRNMRGKLPEGCRFLGVVKADGYGHGAVPVARCLEEAGASYLAVACIDEAAELRQAEIGLPILILGLTPPNLAVQLAGMDITQGVSDIETARRMSQLLENTGKTLKVHIKLDTGMGRIGFRADDETALREMAELLRLPGLAAEGIFTHLAVSDEPGGEAYTRLQFERFIRTIELLEKTTGHQFAIRHCVNSGAMVNYREFCLDMVRPGIATYGMYPGPDEGGLDLRPAMQLRSRIAAITEHAAGDTISYGRTFTAAAPMRIAVLPIGYADGLHRVLSNQMEVLICGKRAKQIGRICMDMCMVDITHIPECRVGDVATIFGRDGDAFIPVEEQAEKAGTISYEMVCAISKRVPRVYVD